MAINRFLPLIVPFLVGILLEIFYFFPTIIYIVLVVILLLFLFAIRQFRGASSKNEDWWNLLILPVIFTFSLVVFSTMVTSKLLVQILFAFNVVFLYFYFISIYFYLIKTEEQVKYSLDNLSSYGNFLAYYFAASSVYGLQAFLGVRTWILMMFLLVISGLIVYQVLWANRIHSKAGLFYVLISMLVLVELAWSASFLTLSYYILGLILAVCYYILIGLVRFYLLGNLDKKKVKLYLIFGFSSILTVLFTARWM